MMRILVPKGIILSHIKYIVRQRKAPACSKNGLAKSTGYIPHANTHYTRNMRARVLLSQQT